MNPENSLENIIQTLKTLEDGIHSLRGSLHVCEQQVQSLIQSGKYSEREVSRIESLINGLSLEIDKIKDWSEGVKPIVYGASVTTDSLKRMDNRLTEYSVMIAKIEKDVAESSFCDRRTEDEIIALSSRLGALEAELDDRVDGLRSDIRQAFVSKNDFLNAQRNLLWGAFAFVGTSLVSWLINNL